MSGAMRYTFAAIVDQEDVDETWVPRVVDKAGTVAWDPTDGEPKRFRATGLTVYRGSPNSDGRLLKVEDVSITVYISSARLVAVCRKFDKGGGWFGGLTAMVVFNAVSKARAAIRSHGKFLVGQMRWPWLSDVGYTEKTGWLSHNQLRLVAMDEAGARVYADFKLPKDANARAIADRILALAAAARGAGEVPALPRYDSQSKKFALIGLPGAKKAMARTAYPSANGAEPTEPPSSSESHSKPGNPAQPAPAASSPDPAAQESPGRCTTCGEPATERARFCRFCGGQVITDGPSSQATGLRTSDAPAGDSAQAAVPGIATARAGGELASAAAVPTSPEAQPTAGVDAPPAEPGCSEPSCGDCGREAPHGAKFCRFCGGSVVAPEHSAQPVQELAPAPDGPPAQAPMCPSCGARAASGHQFCRSCGQPLHAAVTPAAPRAPQPGLAPEPATRVMAHGEAARDGGAGASRNRPAFRAVAAAGGVLVVGAVVLAAVSLSKDGSYGGRTPNTSVITATGVTGSPGAVGGADSPAETVKGDGYEFQVPAGPDWSVGEPTTANGDALVDRRVDGPGGIVVRVVHTANERAQPDPDAIVATAPFESAVPDSRMFTVSGFPTPECERGRCDDFVLNAPEFGGLAFLASDSGGPASQAARTMAGTLSVGDASPERTGYVIETSGDSPAQFGNFRDDGVSPAGRALREAFGAPTSQTPSQGGCDLQWEGIGVTAEVTTYGQEGIDACKDGYFIRARLEGAMWKTLQGLRVGSPVEKADAEDLCTPRGVTECAGEPPYYPNGATLGVHKIECAPGLFPTVIATAAVGRVDGFWVYTHGCE